MDCIRPQASLSFTTELINLLVKTICFDKGRKLMR